jgi:hypothetical protein
MTTIIELIAKLEALKGAYGGDMEVRLQGTRGSDGTGDLDPLKTLIARAHHDSARGLVGDLKDTPDSQPVLVSMSTQTSTSSRQKPTLLVNWSTCPE